MTDQSPELGPPSAQGLSAAVGSEGSKLVALVADLVT